MGKQTGISWTDRTQNFWWGCTEAGDDCSNCYAKSLALRFKGLEWGAGTPRMRTSIQNWHQPLKWNREAVASDCRFRVFAQSMADFFDAEVDPSWRAEALADVIRPTTSLDWQVLSKRPAVMARDFAALWGDDPWPHVWAGTSVGMDSVLDARLGPFEDVPARTRFLSVEPMIGPCDRLGQWMEGLQENGGLHWVICGGESGPHARPFHIEWARRLRDACRDLGIVFFLKQLGSNASLEGRSFPTRSSHGSDPSEWPEDLQIQDFPTSPAAIGGAA